MSFSSPFILHDRREAGKLLAARLKNDKGLKNAIVLGLARGGVEVAFEIAKELSLPLNAVVPRKIGAPGNSEFAIGAITEDGQGVFNDSVIRMLNVSSDYLNREIARERDKALTRLHLYRKNAPLPELKESTVILADDGAATGLTMIASIGFMRRLGVRRIVAALPVASTDAFRLVEEQADESVCLHIDDNFGSVSRFYRLFPQVEDQDVIDLLNLSRSEVNP